MEMQITATGQQQVDSSSNALKRSLASIKGSVVPQQVKINHPALRKTFKHAYDISDAHLYYCAVFCRATLGHEVVAPELENLNALIGNTARELILLAEQMQKVADENGVSSGINLVDQVVDTQASTPLSKRCIEIYRTADKYLALIDALWIEGVVDDDRHAKAASVMSQTCHKLSRQIEDVFRRLLAENNKRKAFRQGSVATLNSQDARKVA